MELNDVEFNEVLRRARQQSTKEPTLRHLGADVGDALNNIQIGIQRQRWDDVPLGYVILLDDVLPNLPQQPGAEV